MRARRNDRPAIEMNAATMARYREQLKNYYYDASRYDTYLDQLGIKFPTIAKE
jgi:aminobenzoyl-glutamate utilization protein B